MARRATAILVAGLLVIIVAALIRSRQPGSIPSTPRPGEPVKALPIPETPVFVLPAPGESVVIRGRVLDGKTGKPVSRAQIFFHHPRPVRAGERLEQSLDAWYRTEGGGITTLGRLYQHDQPDRAYDRPQAGVDPLSQTESGETGEFEITLAVLGGIFECRHPGYLTVFRPYFAEYKQREVLIHLFPGVLVRGRVIRVDGEPLREKLRVGFFGRTPRLGMAGVWDCETDGFGAFAVEVAAPEILPKIQVLGWRTVSPDRPVEVVAGMSLEIVARRAPLLRVFDAVSKAPIERFSVLMGRPGLPGNWLRGEFSAPGGVLALLYDTIPDSSYEGLFRIQVWADGRVPFERDVPELLKSEDIEAALDRGEAPSVSGIVTRKGGPVEGASVSLNSGFQMTNGWKPEKLAPVASVATGPEGTFKLSAPAGTYVLIVRADSTVHAISIQAPSGHVAIELDSVAEVRVRVRDSLGKAVIGTTVLLQSADSGRRWTGTSDGAGIATFNSIPPGDLWAAPGKIYYPGANEYSNNTGTWTKFQAAAGQATTVDLTVDEADSQKPLAARLAIRGVTNLEGWTITNASVYAKGEALAIGADGGFQVPNRLAGIRILSPWGDRWQFIPPRNVGDSWNVDLDPNGPGYDGVIRDQATGDVISDLAIYVTGKGQGSWGLNSKTDSEGKFRLRGLGPGSIRMDLSKDGEYGVTFEPSKSPVTDPPVTRLAIPKTIDRLSLEGVNNRKVSGRLLDSATGSGVSDSSVNVLAILSVPDGQLMAGLKSSYSVVDGEGRFSVTAPTAPRYRAQIFFRSGRPDSAYYEREWASSTSGDVVIDFRVP